MSNLISKRLLIGIVFLSQQAFAYEPNWKSLGEGVFIDKKSVRDHGDLKTATILHWNGEKYNFTFDCKLQTAREILFPDRVYFANNNFYFSKALEYVCTNSALRWFK